MYISPVINSLKEFLSRFQNGARKDFHYKPLRIVDEMRTMAARTSGAETSEDLKEVETALENLAAMRGISEFAYFKNLSIWQRPWRGRQTRLRYDVVERLKTLSRERKEEETSASFIISAKLADICSDLLNVCNGCKYANGKILTGKLPNPCSECENEKRKEIWKSLGAEMGQRSSLEGKELIPRG
jgi:vacuolar-type H+-ATPase subunit I/STV1